MALPLPVQGSLFEEVDLAPSPSALTSASATPAVGPRPVSPPSSPVSPSNDGLRIHPQATHRSVLGGHPVAYLLRRSARRSIGFTVGSQGLVVTAPRWVTVGAIEAALQSKAAWVLRKLAAVQQHRLIQPPALDWSDAVSVPWLGGVLVVRVGWPGSGLPPAAGRRVAEWGGELWVDLPTPVRPAQLRDAVQAWMQQQATAHFTERLNHHAPRLGVRWTRLRLSSAATRWGSAKADGSIRLHWRLMQFPPEVIDYVVVHELAHLRHMDHSPRFWQTVAGVLPDYAALRARLRGERLAPW